MNHKDTQVLINEALKADDRVWVRQANSLDLDKIKLLDLIDCHDQNIIRLIFGEIELRKKFFVEVDGRYVFKKDELRFFIESTKIDNTYTRFRNKIGLTSNGKFITERNEVVLDFPFKDCVLQGCQDKENAKSDEKPLNQVIARDEIDRLFEPKALVNWKRFDKNGEHEI